MEVKLTVTAGPHLGREFVFDQPDTFLVGRVGDAHFKLSYDDPYFSRRHFLVEVNPPRCRVLDLNSRNGTRVNGRRVASAEVRDGDEVSAGHTAFRVAVAAGPDAGQTVTVPPEEGRPPLATGPAAGSPPPAVPGYELGAELGRGGMGAVYRATRAADGAAVAVKAISPAAGGGPRPVERFLREARILGDLRHPRIVGFHEAGEAGGVVYLVMELVDGPDAGRVLADRGPLPVRTAVRLASQVLTGLAHAHSKGFVHRDLKPANVLIGGRGATREAKLADFGLARVYETSRLSGLTLQGEVGGTPAFMAPEQVTHYRAVRPAADQYSAAATLYKLLTDHPVHDLPTGTTAQLVCVATEPPVPIRARRADLPDGLAEVVHKALSRDPADRYPDVLAFRQALAPFG